VRLFSTLPAAVLALSMTCQAQEAPKPDLITEAVSIAWESPDYPAAAKLKSEQGIASVRIDFVNGKPSGDASIAKSSQSPELDEAALAYLRRVKLRASGTEAAPEVKKMLVDVEFVRDSIVTLGKKPCAELSADIAHFRKTNPTLELTKMRLYKMSLGMVALSGDMKNVPAMVKLSKIMPAAYSATALACESKPEAVYLQELLNSLTAAAK
jgi:TonB family protein